MQPTYGPHYSKNMQSLIQKIAQIHGVDLTKPEAHIKLINEPFMPLSIQNIGGNRIAVSHTFVQEDDVMFDPEIVFWIDERMFPDQNWMPISFRQDPWPGEKQYVSFKDGLPSNFNKPAQHSLVGYCITWAKNLKDQGFLKAVREAERQTAG